MPARWMDSGAGVGAGGVAGGRVTKVHSGDRSTDPTGTNA